MWRIPLGTEQDVLLLAPSWSGWQPAWQAAALLLSLLVPLAAIAMLYRWELKLVTRRTASALIVFRLLLFLAIWTLTALQPTLAYVEVEEAPSRVLVAVDLSGSMETADPQRTEAEKSALARTLGIEAAPAAARSTDIDTLPRREIARRLLTGPPRLLERLGGQHQIEIVGFHQTLLEGDPAAVQALFDAAAGPGTNLTLPLERSLQQRSDDSKLVGVIVLTDGQHNDGSAPGFLAKELSHPGVPLYPVAIGSKEPPIDVAVLEAQAPTQLFKDAEGTIAARLRVHGLPAGKVVVELHGPPGFTKQVETIDHDGSNRIHRVDFPIKLADTGTHAFEVQARPEMKAVAEITTENNRLPAVVRVASDKSRVLVIDDEARWEYHYLTKALTRDPDLALDRVLLSPPRIGAIADDELEKAGHAKRRLPAADKGREDPLWQYDAIVLGDVAPAHLPRLECARLERYVAERGGTLILSAGKRHLPLDYASFPSDDPLLKLVPLEQFKPLVSKGFAVKVTPLGEQTPFLQLDPTLEESRKRWSALPKHHWGVVGKAKPAATVLARAKADEMTLPDDESALIVQQQYGFGKVVFCGLESTWRWRYRVGDHYHHRYWGQLMRWAVADPFLPEGNRHVRYGSKAPVYRHDQEVELLMRLGEETPLPASPKLNVKRRREGVSDEIAASVLLMPHAQRPRLFEAKVRDLPPGAYELEVETPELRDALSDAASKPGRSHGFTVLPPETGEHVELATNWELLQSLAHLSGGRLFTAADAAELPDLLARQVQRREQRSEHRPWQDLPPAGWILGCLLGLLTLEWILRKVAGLP